MLGTNGHVWERTGIVGNKRAQTGKLKIWHEKIGVLFDVHIANQFLLYEEINREGTACSGGCYDGSCQCTERV